MTEQNENHRELIMDEYILKTIISLQVTLSSMSKDLDQKTEVLHEVAKNITAMAYNIKEMRDKIEKKDALNKEFIESMEHLNRKIELIEVKFENDNSQVQGHIKEIKYAVQQLSDSVLELRTEKKIIEKQEASKKLDISDFFSKLWESIKSAKTILYVVLSISLILAAIVSGPGFLPELLKLLKSLLG